MSGPDSYIECPRAVARTNAFRKQMKLPKIVKGVINCLGPCQKKFLSPDKSRVRMCNACKKINRY